MKVLIAILLFSICNVAFSQSEYAEVDSYARNLPKKFPVKKVDTLTKYLTNKYESDELKVRSIFIWITDNISYDVYSYYKGNIDNEDTQVKNVLYYKRTVCAGYANLFQAMCDIAEIPCLTVSGRANNNAGIGPHAWNLVKIEGEWKLMDVTWGSGAINEKNVYVKRLNEKYFFAEANYFAKKHFPHNPIFQMKEFPVSWNKFVNETSIPNQPKEAINFNDSINKVYNLPNPEKEIYTKINFLNPSKSEKEYLVSKYIQIAQRRMSPEHENEYTDEDIVGYINDLITYVKENKLNPQFIKYLKLLRSLKTHENLEED